MSRRTLGLVLLVSLGVNVGILATLAVDRLRDGGEATREPSVAPAPEETGDELSELFDPATPEVGEPDGPSAERPKGVELGEPARSGPETGEEGDREPGLGEPVPFDPGTGPGGRPLREAGEPAGGGEPAHDREVPSGGGPEPEELIGPRAEGPAAGDEPLAPTDPGGGEGEPRELPQQIGWRLEALADRLGLAGEARREFVAVQTRFFRDTFVRRQEILRLQRVVREELTSPRPDRRRLAEANERLAAAREELDRTFIEAVLESRRILGPAQEREYLRFLARLRAVSEGRREGGPPERSGPGPRRLPPPP